MKGIRLFPKLFFTHTAIALVSVVSLSLLFLLLFREALIQRTLDQLSSINMLKKNHLDEYFTETRNTLTFHFAETQNTSATELERIKRIYDFTSIAVWDEKNQKLTSTSDSSLVKIMNCFSPSSPHNFKAVEVTACGDSATTLIVYVLPWRESIILFLEKFEKIERFLMETTGMGSTGESYLIGPDFTMRSQSRFLTKKIHRTPVDSVATKQILSSGMGGVIQDYRGVKVLSMNRAINLEGLQWILISEIDFDEALQPLSRWRNYIIITTIIIGLLIVGITYLTSRSISQPILNLKTIIGNLSQGIIQAEKLNSTDASEVGQMAKAIQELSAGLAHTTQFANEVGHGKFDASYTLLSEQDSLGLALINMRDKLSTLTDEQIKFVREKTAAILEAQENERKRIVQELHDGVGQMLTGTRLRALMLSETDPVRNEVISLINETIAEIKRISYNVMPNAIVDFGLEAALKGLCENVRKTSQLLVDFKYVREYNRTISFETSIGVFRIVQEGFNNIMKHAGASQAELYVLASEHELYFLLKDNGRGFNTLTTKPSPGIGLNSMKERAQLLNGNLEIHSSAEGTVVEGKVPITSNALPA